MVSSLACDAPPLLCRRGCGVLLLSRRFSEVKKDFRSPSALSVSSKVFARNALGNRVNEASTIGGVRLEKNVRGKRPVATLKVNGVSLRRIICVAYPVS